LLIDITSHSCKPYIAACVDIGECHFKYKFITNPASMFFEAELSLLILLIDDFLDIYI